MTPAPNLQELIETIQRDAGSGDVLDQLATASATVTELNETSDAALGYFVDRARRAGRSWVEISGVLGVTKQAVHKRFGPAATAAKPRLERFTERARNVFETSTTIATRAGHGYVGTEHLLLAQYAEPEAVAAEILVAAGLTEERVREAVRAHVPDEPEPFEGDPAFTFRAADAMVGALSEALKLGHNYIGTEHLLLALYRDPGGLAAQIMTRLGLDQETAHVKVTEALAEFQKK